MARYLLDIGFIVVILARVAEHRYVGRTYVVVALALQFGFLLMYLQGAWTF